MAIKNKNGHAVTSVLPDGSAHNAVSPVTVTYPPSVQESRGKSKSTGGFPAAK